MEDIRSGSISRVNTMNGMGRESSIRRDKLWIFSLISRRKTNDALPWTWTNCLEMHEMYGGTARLRRRYRCDGMWWDECNPARPAAPLRNKPLAMNLVPFYNAFYFNENLLFCNLVTTHNLLRFRSNAVAACICIRDRDGLLRALLRQRRLQYSLKGTYYRISQIN